MPIGGGFCKYVRLAQTNALPFQDRIVMTHLVNKLPAVLITESQQDPDYRFKTLLAAEDSDVWKRPGVDGRY
jgi:hypothetical protein